jgi:hypothetical protein
VEGVGHKLSLDNYFSSMQLFSALHNRKIKFWHSLSKQARHASKLRAKDLETEEG